MNAKRTQAGLLVTLAITLVPALAAAQSYRDAVLASAPTAYWTLDETDGVAVDASGNGHDGAPEGSPGYGAASLLPNGQGSAVALSDGNRFFVDAFEKWNASSTGYTVSYWIRFDAPSSGSNYTAVLGDGVAGGTFNMMQYLQFDPATGTYCPRPHYGSNNGGWDPSPCSVGAYVSPNVAHHVVVAWDRATGTVRIQIDDVRFVQTGKPTDVPANTALPMWLGHDDREAGWNLVLDEPAFWDRPLSDAEIQAQVDAAYRLDSDGDGVGDEDDICALGNDFEDFDADSVPDACDNCPLVGNAAQSDTDGDGSGDVCDDSDGDGTTDSADNCPFVGNVSQGDSDGDGEGDACDFDDDNDGVDDPDDNCPVAANPGQADYDGDGEGDACDGDSDGDGAPDANEPAGCLDTPLDLAVDVNGCSGAQLVATTCGECADHANSGAFVSCVSRTSNDAKSAGLISGRDKAALVRVSAKSCE